MKKKIQKIPNIKAEKIVDRLILCTYCDEPFKECDTIIPNVGLVLGETDVVKWRNRFWHSGCLKDYQKQGNIKP